jgi:hypothetical protein
LIYEKQFSRDPLRPASEVSNFELDRLYYPRFIACAPVRAFCVPIKGAYHDTLYPDLRNPTEPDLFDLMGAGGGPRRPGNTIRKVYLCRAQSNLGPAGSLLLFYKGKSNDLPSQAMTSVGIFEKLDSAQSTKDLMLLTGGRSVYSEAELREWKASGVQPVKVINYLLAAYIDPPISIVELRDLGIMGSHLPQSIFELDRGKFDRLLPRLNLGFRT